MIESTSQSPAGAALWSGLNRSMSPTFATPALLPALLLVVLLAACLPDIQKGEPPAKGTAVTEDASGSGEPPITDDTGGNEIPDFSPITAIFPIDGATGVDRSGSVVVTFSPSMDAASVEGAFSLSDGSVDVDIEGSFAWSEDETAVTFTPDGILAELTTYTTTILASAKEASGIPMSADFSSSFATTAAWTDIASGESFNFALKSDGTLWGCGQNSWGQLGLGDVLNRSTFTQVGGDSWAELSASSTHVLAISSVGTLWTWGGEVTERWDWGMSLAGLPRSCCPGRAIGRMSRREPYTLWR